MNKLRHLMIDRMLSKDVFIKKGQRIDDILKTKIASRSQLTDLQIAKIDELGKDIGKDDVFRLVSVHTPFEDFTPITFDMVFSYDDLNVAENVELILEHIVYLRDNYLLQLPLGHHCEIYVKIKSGRPKLFDQLPIDSYDRVRIGICNMSDWSALRNELEISKKEIEEWRQNTKNYPQQKL